MARTGRRARKLKTRNEDTWVIITEDARKLNQQVSKESDQFIDRIDLLIDMIIAPKAA